MNIQTIGQILFLGGGVFLLVCGGVVLLRKDGKLALAGLFFGVMCLGVGTFGPTFLKDYRPYMDLLSGLTDEASAEVYQKFFEEVAWGGVPAQVAEAGLALTLERPLPEMRAALDRSIAGANDGAGRLLLENALRDLDAKEMQAERIAAQAGTAGGLTRDDLVSLDPSTQRLLVRPLGDLPLARREQLQIDPRFLRDLATAGDRKMDRPR